MRFFFIFALFMAAALAVIEVTEVLPLDVELLWRFETRSNNTSLSVYDTESGDLVAETCRSFLEGDIPVDFSHVDKDGSGNFTVGKKTFMVDCQVETSRGPKCSRRLTPSFAVVRCSNITWYAEEYSQRDRSNCFRDVDSYTAALHAIPADKTCVVRSGDVLKSSHLSKKGYWASPKNARVDNITTKSYHHKQLSETIDCREAESCSVGKMDSESFTIGWSVTGNEVGKKFFASFGLSVTKSWTTGNTYTCNGARGQTVCIWYKTAHTSYKVRNMKPKWWGFIGPDEFEGKSYILNAPNKKNRGGGYYCVVDRCGAKGDEFWVKMGSDRYFTQFGAKDSN
ncbi:hypothetical protein B0J13DRAFT_646174 [Dactylonectria estremocensis]|uniref:Ig-like domain-containing protein n=1 Tax=Dactylonectria estremocensis TaxID=1079267 RepID=A0A9P9IPQ1_9HYPO|nr:hypothetical protein B0J13DRAFT_646174 [Dactylonectria estremocensis]